jgi:hypothetical protein
MEPRPYVTVAYPAIPRPAQTIRHVLTTAAPTTENGAPIEGGGEVWAGEGPPTVEIVAGMEPGDTYIDTLSGDVFRYNP